MDNEFAAAAIAPDTAAIEERWAVVEGHRIRYLTGGQGPALLLIHGLLGYSFSWRRNLPELARCATVYAVDLPGVGFSERSPDYACDLRSLAAMIRGFLAVVGVNQADILGTSHGGGVAMMLAADALRRGTPRVRSLILVAPINPWSRIGRMRARVFGSQVGSRLMIASWGAHRVLAPIMMRRMFGDSARIPAGALQGYLGPCAVPGTAQHLVKIASHWNADLERLRHDMAQVRNLPALLIQGTRDRLVAPRSALQLRRQFAQAELHLLDGLGHLPYEEAPAEFNHVVTTFLARLPVTSAGNELPR